MKKFISVVLVSTLFLFIVACDKNTVKKSQQAKNKVSVEKKNIDDKNSKKESPEADNKNKVSVEEKNIDDKNTTIETPKVENNNEVIVKEENVDDKNITTEPPNVENELIVAGGFNKVVGVCEFGVDGVDVKRRIEPPNANKNSKSYEVQTEGNTYIDVSIMMGSLKNEPIKIDGFTSAKIKVNGREYTCFVVTESVNGDDFQKGASIAPSEGRVIHYLAEVPVAQANGEMKFTVSVNGKKYSNIFQLSYL